jgi:hypothetical protein
MVVETNGEALVDAVRGIAGHRRVVFEEGTLAGWRVSLTSEHRFVDAGEVGTGAEIVGGEGIRDGRR